MSFLNDYSNFWSVVESLGAFLTLGFALFLFFNDPIRRWKFLGFRPTVITVLFDPKLKKILLVKFKTWGLNQGSIYGDEITTTIEDTLHRELGIDDSLYRIYLINPLGVARITDRRRIKRVALGSISLFPNLIGKGYIGCFLDTDLTKLKRKVKLGHGIESFGIFSIREAREKLTESAGVDNQSKQKIYHKIFEVLDDLTINWHTRGRSL